MKYACLLHSNITWLHNLSPRQLNSSHAATWVDGGDFIPMSLAAIIIS